MKAQFWMTEDGAAVWNAMMHQANRWAEKQAAEFLWRYHFRDLSHYWLCVRTVK